MRLFTAIVGLALAVLGCVQPPKGAVYQCATDRDCLGDEECVVDKCLPRVDGGAPVVHADAGLADAAIAGLDAQTARPDAETIPPDAGHVVVKADGSVVVIVTDAGIPVGVDAAVVLVPDTGFVAYSCQDLVKQGGTVADGLATIYARGDGGLVPLEVYCLHSLEAGGWTLVARSAAHASSDLFGWYQVVGSVTDTATPYCLGALARGLKFSELLVTSQGLSLDQYDYAPMGLDRFRVGLASNWDQPDAGVANLQVVDVSASGGGCRDESNNGAMLGYAGCTWATDRIFLRDNGRCENYGFYADGFALAYEGCVGNGGMSGNLHLKQGLLFVR